MSPNSWHKQNINCLWSRGIILKNDKEDEEIAMEVMKLFNTQSIYVTPSKSNVDDRIKTFSMNKVTIAYLENSTLTYVNHNGHGANHDNQSAICKFGKIIYQN